MRLLLRLVPHRVTLNTRPTSVLSICRFTSSSASSSRTPESPGVQLQLPRTIAGLLRSPTPENASVSVTVHGWVRSVRRMGKICFAHISDGSTAIPLQAVLSPSQAAGLSMGASVEMRGIWKPAPADSAQRAELVAEEVKTLGPADPETYPLQKKYQSPEYLRTLPHLRSRIPYNTNILRLRSFITSHISRFFEEHEFVQCYPPIITSSDCEGGGETFGVSPPDFFRTPKYLTVSTQLHLEALAAATPRVWTLSPTFRAEKSDTTRHLSEFYMLEAELSFITTLDPLLDLIETMLRGLVSSLGQSSLGTELLHCPHHETVVMSDRWARICSPEKWKRITYTEAIEALQSNTTELKFVYPPTWGGPLQTEHEHFLTAYFDGVVFVTDYPAAVKPFYMLPSQISDRPTVANFDLLLPDIGELIGGSLREHRYDEIMESIRRNGMEVGGKYATLKWYAELRKWGSVPHGGFGLGMERLVAYLAGLDNIREAAAWPRWAGRCDG